MHAVNPTHGIKCQKNTETFSKRREGSQQTSCKAITDIVIFSRVDINDWMSSGYTRSLSLWYWICN